MRTFLQVLTATAAIRSPLIRSLYIYICIYNCIYIYMCVYSNVLSLVCRPILWLMFHVTASQLFVHCWVRATASIVRAKRFYLDDILNNCWTYPLLLFITCASFFFMSSFVLLFLLLFIFSSQTSSFMLQSETVLPVHCQDRFWGGFWMFGTLLETR